MTEEETTAPAPAPDESTTPAPAPPPGSVAGTGKPAGSRRPVIIVGLIVAFLAVVLFIVKNNVSADDLKVGTCFNIPDGTSISTVEQHSCTESHNGEVFFVGEYDGESFPISISLDSYIDDNCVPAFGSYVGTAFEDAADLTIGYFHPNRDGWDDGERTITCYVARTDQGAMTQSLQGSGSQ